MIPAVNVGTRIGIDSHRHRALLDGRGDTGIVPGLVVHAMTRVAPARREREQQRLASRAGARERVAAPLEPTDHSHLPGDLAYQMTELGDDELLEREPTSVRGAGQREQRASVHDAGLRPRQHRRRADLLVGQYAEQLAETGEPLVEQRLYGLECRVA